VRVARENFFIAFVRSFPLLVKTDFFSVLCLSLPFRSSVLECVCVRVCVSLVICVCSLCLYVKGSSYSPLSGREDWYSPRVQRNQETSTQRRCIADLDSNVKKRRRNGLVCSTCRERPRGVCVRVNECESVVVQGGGGGG